MGAVTVATNRNEVSLLNHSLSQSLSDSDVDNCNRLFWLRNAKYEARLLLDLGKELGMTCKGNEDEMLRKIQELEQRDKDMAKPKGVDGFDKGDQ